MTSALPLSVRLAVGLKRCLTQEAVQALCKTLEAEVKERPEAERAALRGIVARRLKEIGETQ